MLICNHVLAGAIIGLRSPTPAAALGVGVASHVAMDALPHWGMPEEEYLRVARVDGIAGLALIALILPTTRPNDRLRVAAGIAGACLPDTEQVTLHFWNRRFHPAWFARLHGAVQREHSWAWQEPLLATALAAAFVAMRVRQRPHVDRVE